VVLRYTVRVNRLHRGTVCLSYEGFTNHSLEYPGPSKKRADLLMDQSINTKREAAVLEPAPPPIAKKSGSLTLPISPETLWFALLLTVCYWPTLAMTGRVLVNSEDMAHGFFAPIIAAYVAWQTRETAFAKESQPNRWGLLVLALAAIPALAGTLGA